MKKTYFLLITLFFSAPEVFAQQNRPPAIEIKPTGEGTGLGLSLSYDIVAKGHDGNISANNVNDGGSEFIVLLPVSSQVQ